jgi:hypothetical protein
MSLQELADRRAIRELKARYFRLVDAKEWDAWRELFADDVHAELPDAGRTFDDADSFVAFVREMTEPASCVRQGHMPELTFDGPGLAHGTWSLTDYDEWPSENGERRGWEGFGRYDETYRKVGGEWKIASLLITYLRQDPLPREPLPDDPQEVPLRSFGDAEPAPASEPTAQQLLDAELISELKARYFRCVMEQDWDGFRRVFTDDARIDLADGYVIDGADAFVAALQDLLAGVRLVIQGHTPAITIDSPTEAHGAWAIAEYLERPSDPDSGERRGFRGYGWERETYRKLDGEWRIASMRLNYLRLDPLPHEPLPERIAGLGEVTLPS